MCSGEKSGKGKGGFTLVEIMVVVVVIGLLASLAVPAFMRARNSSAASRFANDLRIMRDGVVQYNFEYGEWAGDGFPGTTPSYTLSSGAKGQASVPESVWTGVNSLGGRWDWEGVLGARMGISSRSHSATDAQLLIIDEMIDNGDLTTGDFVKVNDTTAFYGVD